MVPQPTRRRAGKLWALLLILAVSLELVLVATHQVRAQGAATPEAAGTSAATETPTPVATAAAAQESTHAASVAALDKPPSGSDSETVQLYYDYIFADYLGQHNKLRTEIRWTGVFWIFFWALVMSGFFYFFVAYFGHVHREHGELYGIVSFAGSILERIGAVSLFNKVVWTATILAALYFIITHVLRGQLY